MQPLGYQMHPKSCWVVSVLNALLMLYGDKDLIPGLAYRLLHTVLTDEGVSITGPDRDDWKIVLDGLQAKTGLIIETVQGERVEPVLRRMSFRNSVAVCDIAAGSHAILINGRSRGWLEAFDPDWENVRIHRSRDDAFEVMPEVAKHRQGLVNVRIRPEYLVRTGRGKTGRFQIGAVQRRTLTVLTRPEGMRLNSA